jgi:hypothetical protein
MNLLDRMKDLIARWEPHREPMLKAITETHGTHTEDDVLAMILAGNLTLITSDKSAIVVETVKFPRLSALNVFLAGGNFADMIEHEPALLAEAQRRGCSRITGGGRTEWIAALRDRSDGFRGYKVGGAFVYKDI